MMKTVAMLLIALVMAASGVALACYADDAPGGVVIGWVLVAGAGALSVRAFQRRMPKPECRNPEE
jgi:hypothetical protein